MPRDDLSIDFVVKNMPQTEPLDPSLILDDWINRVQNLPEEIRFMQDEIADKDRQYHECVRMIDDRDAKIQKWIKSNGSHEPNPKEDQLRSQIREQYARADQLAQDKIAMARKLQINMDKHLRNLDIQIKLLYDRAEPGFTDPDEVPSLLRQSAANHTMPTIRASNPAAMVSAVPHNVAPINTSLAAGNNPALARLPSNPQIRQTPVQQVVQQTQHAASAPATPAAASMIMNRHRESSAGPATKRGPRTVTGLGNAPTTSSGLARHSSLGPGTPKNSTPTAPNGVTRAGSAGPRSGPAKTTPGPSSRRGTPTAGISRKKPPPPKSSLKRVKKLKSRNSPASTADSDLSDVGSGGEDAEGDDAQSGGSPEPDKEEEAEEGEGGGDDKKYCLCHNVSHGDMVACDNENCPYEWFHWTCVGLKSEPNGTWYCPECAEKLKKSK